MSKHPDIGNGYPIREIALDSINLSLHPNRLREFRREKVDELAASMKVSGLINPITIWQNVVRRLSIGRWTAPRPCRPEAQMEIDQVPRPR